MPPQQQKPKTKQASLEAGLSAHTIDMQAGEIYVFLEEDRGGLLTCLSVALKGIGTLIGPFLRLVQRWLPEFAERAWTPRMHASGAHDADGACTAASSNVDLRHALMAFDRQFTEVVRCKQTVVRRVRGTSRGRIGCL